MPTRDLICSRDFVLWFNMIPSTVIDPASWISNPLIHLINVDFPDPEGPQTTTRSPCFTLSETSFKAANLPKFFEIFLISISLSLGLLGMKSPNIRPNKHLKTDKGNDTMPKSPNLVAFSTALRSFC